ncbi:mitochondrial 37S ribosomal protein mS45 [Dipodascopsis tothii]|uniref:mitochondrial 37S ribosomal protein mS45 n=1 Tax=Dipodascopsis tothii TaxID=44089 RepID=UPI0034CF974F
MALLGHPHRCALARPGAGAAVPTVLGAVFAAAPQAGQRRNYPGPGPSAYNRQSPLTHADADAKRKTLPRLQMLEWLGPKDVKGDHTSSVYYYPPKNHVPNYFDYSRSSIVGRELNMAQRRAPGGKRIRARRPDEVNYYPFPQNEHTKTSFLLSDELKQHIIAAATEKKMPIRQVSSMYGVKIERVEAVLKLAAIEREWESKNLIEGDLKVFADRMYDMLPVTRARLDSVLYGPGRIGSQADRQGTEKTSEIIMPPITQQSTFVTVEESEEFTASDAAKFWKIQSAHEILDKNMEGTKTTKAKDNAVVVKSGRFEWKCTPAKAGEVGYRYGASRDDRKKYRKVCFDSHGRLSYA